MLGNFFFSSAVDIGRLTQERFKGTGACRSNKDTSDNRNLEANEILSVSWFTMCRSSLDPKFLGMNLGLKRQADHLVCLDAFSPEMSFALGYPWAFFLSFSFVMSF